MRVTEEQKQEYLSWIYDEMQRHGLTKEEIPYVIGKTGFMSAFNKYPEIQLHYDPKDAVNEIFMVAARA